MIFVSVDHDFQIAVHIAERQVGKRNPLAETDNVIAAAVRNRIQAVAEVPDISIIVHAAGKLVITFAADKNIAAAFAVDAVIAVTAQKQIVAGGAVHVIVFIGSLFGGQRAFGQRIVPPDGADIVICPGRAVGKFDIINGLRGGSAFYKIAVYGDFIGAVVQAQN